MIRQGFSISCIPAENNPIGYEVWINSNAHEGTKCFGSRQLHIGTMNALPGEVSSRDFSEWLDGMISLLSAYSRKQITVHDMASISSATQDAERASETLSQNM